VLDRELELLTQALANCETLLDSELVWVFWAADWVRNKGGRLSPSQLGRLEGYVARTERPLPPKTPRRPGDPHGKTG
jgi:hypothetical protein